MNKKPAPAPVESDNPHPSHEGEAPQTPTFQDTGIQDHYSEAFEDMAYRGIPLPLAAKHHKIRPDNLTRAFNRPAVRAVYNQIVKSIREGAGVQAYLRNVELSVSSSSDHVKADLNKWIAGVDGIAALKRVEGRMHHTHSFDGFEYPTLDVTPADADPDQTQDVDEQGQD